ncbi:hypothetical protein JTE90_015550 [Oedothorax gibbosus]|uniref:C2H2-type domain-containing protein n=1 Tax=Oedothorax gibbosus TaxID=931172 RepID=A0AAV6TVA4_9ARAC|nr:hypothetical protein JTE90_015550 [Oedothorax gibbosus]
MEKILHSCEVCGKEFNKRFNLTRHRRIHREEKFECEECHIKFVNEDKLSRHMSTHTGKKLFSCEVSNEKFNQKSHLPKLEGLHECEICHMKFPNKHKLSEHLHVHTEEKLSSCEVDVNSLPETVVSPSTTVLCTGNDFIM